MDISVKEGIHKNKIKLIDNGQKRTNTNRMRSVCARVCVYVYGLR